jgi:Fe-Mn family superoxide dismutase
LPYEIGALEPVVSGHLLEFHYGKHHRTYVNNLNNLLAQEAEALDRNDVKTAVSLSQAIKFNGGGHLNHEFFWESLCPQAESELPDESTVLHRYICDAWGTKEKFIEQFNARTASIQGSGWGWLVYNKSKDTISYRITANQDLITDVNPQLVPLLNMDIWEHAYYLDYKNARPQYLTQMWKIVNWQKVEDRLKAARIEAGVAE